MQGDIGKGEEGGSPDSLDSRLVRLDVAGAVIQPPKAVSHRSANRKKRKLRLRIMLVLGSLLLLAAMYGIAKLGPSRIGDSSSAQIAVQSPELMELREKAEELEAKFDELLAKNDGKADEDALALLHQTIDVWKRVVQTSRGFFPDQRELDRVSARLAEFLAAPLLEESVAEEQLAVESRLAGDNKAATEAAQRALQLQQKINQEYPSASQASVPRLTRLERLYRQIRAEPMSAEVSVHEGRARELLAEDKLEEALAEAEKAYSLQSQMVALYPDSPLSRPSRLRDLEQLVADMNSEMLSRRIEKIVKEADSIAEHNSAEAARLLDEAIALQNDINRYYSSARAAGPDAITALEQRRQDLIGKERAVAILARVQELDQALRQRRELAVQSLVTSLQREINAFTRMYPKSTLLGDETAERIRYLQQVGDRLAAIQNAAYGQLRPLPGISGVSMFDREVSQLLYEQVVGVNPSTTRSDFLPVDSITYTDAQNFSRRLSWILALPVRLPTEDEFRSALGDIAAIDLNSGSWNSSNTPDRTPQAVGSSKQNPNGFFDLLGNVAEWLLASPEAQEAPVIGGSARDNPIRLAQVPREMRNLNDRQRNTGFRVIVEISAK